MEGEPISRSLAKYLGTNRHGGCECVCMCVCVGGGMDIFTTGIGNEGDVCLTTWEPIFQIHGELGGQLAIGELGIAMADGGQNGCLKVKYI